MEFVTLVDFLTYSKGVGYLIGGGVLVGFIFYWSFLTEREKS